MLLVKQKKFYITFITLTLAIALQNVIVYLVNITDSVMVGRFSEDALSGVALVNQIQYLLQMSVTGIVEGSLIFSSRAWGEGRIDGVKNMAAISSKVAIGVSMGQVHPFLGKIDAKEEKRGVLGKKMFPTRQLFFPN